LSTYCRGTKEGEKIVKYFTIASTVFKIVFFCRKLIKDRFRFQKVVKLLEIQICGFEISFKPTQTQTPELKSSGISNFNLKE
jgi:hypothetical protein